jgi:predicted nucleotidyltransferase
MQTELIRLARSGSGAVQRELARLGRSGIISVSHVAGRKYVRANPDSPVFAELRGIVEKTIGVAAFLRKLVQEAGERVRFAVLFGSVAKRTDDSASDIDVLLVSNSMTLEEAFALFSSAEVSLGRRVSPTIYTTQEWQRRRREGNPFLTKVLDGKHVVLAGSEDDIST